MNENNYTNPEFEHQTPHPNPKKPFSNKLLIGIVAVVAIGIIVFATSCKHQWSKATCTEPQTCSLCGDTKGKPIGHNFINATCTEPKTCQTCQITQGSAKGHTEGTWTITKSSTLISKGSEDLLCSECEESLDSRTLQKKSPKVEDDHFNFTDKEFIEWFNAEDGTFIHYTELGEYGDDSSFTSYKITWSDGETGTIQLSHGDISDNIIDKNGYITGIYVEFDTMSKAAATVVWIAKEINSKFNTDDAIDTILSDKPYISAQMYVNVIDFSDGSAIAWLEPYK